MEFRARFRSPTITGDTLRAPEPNDNDPMDRFEPPEPPSRRISIASTVVIFHKRGKKKTERTPKFLTDIIKEVPVPNHTAPPIQHLVVPQMDIGGPPVKVESPSKVPNAKTSLLCPPENTTVVSLAVPKRLVEGAGSTRPSCISVSTGSSKTTGSSDEQRSSIFSFGSSISGKRKIGQRKTGQGKLVKDHWLK